MHHLTATISRTIERERLLEGVDHLLAAVSGGADSVAMACALASLRETYPLRITIAHLNHQIRGQDAEDDEIFVRELAASLACECVTERCHVTSLAREKGISLEMAAREARHSFFRELSQQKQAHAVALAHTLDDQVETILLRMFRGCGLLGLAGMAYTTTIDGLRIIRPLRDVSRKEVIDFLHQRNRAWREDESNLSPDHMRNRVRHEILPLIEQRLNPRVRSALLRMADIARADNEWMDDAAGRALSGCLADRRGRTLDVARLTKLPLAEQRRVILKWLAGQRVDQRLLDARTIRRIEQLTLAGIQGSKTIPLRSGWQITRVYNELVLRRHPEKRRRQGYRLELAIPGETPIPGLPYLIRVSRAQGIIRQQDTTIGKLPLHASINADTAGNAPLIVRTWRFGDQFQPLGLDGHQKVQDIFVNSKTPRECRSTWPLIECRNQLVWIPGYRIARGWELSDEHAPALHIDLLPSDHNEPPQSGDSANQR